MASGGPGFPPTKTGRPRPPCASPPSPDGSREAHQPQPGEPKARQSAEGLGKAPERYRESVLCRSTASVSPPVSVGGLRWPSLTRESWALQRPLSSLGLRLVGPVQVTEGQSGRGSQVRIMEHGTASEPPPPPRSWGPRGGHPTPRKTAARVPKPAHAAPKPASAGRTRRRTGHPRRMLMRNKENGCGRGGAVGPGRLLDGGARQPHPPGPGRALGAGAGPGSAAGVL